MGKILNILAFDTVLNKTFITLVKNAQNTNEASFFNKIIESDEKNYHSVYLISEIQNILNENNLKIENLDGIGVNIGPGSFTGIRVCLTVATVMAGQLNVKLVGVPSVEILSKIVEGKNLPVFLDARRGNYIYFEPNFEAKLIDKSNAVKLIQNYNGEIVTDGACHKFFKENSIETINYELGNFNLGEILAKFTIEKLKNSKSENEFHYKNLKPLYLQTPPVF